MTVDIREGYRCTVASLKPVTSPATNAPIARVASVRGRFTTAPWKLAGAAACGCVALAIVDPTRHLVTPPCPLRVLTGWWCPLCGGTRAVSRLLRGDVVGAFHFNALFVATLPLMLLVWASFAFPGRLPRVSGLLANTQRATVAVFALLVVFMVVRNTPLGFDVFRYPGA